MSFIKWCLKSLVIGLILIFTCNMIGSFVEINVPVNIITILVVSIFRLSGLIVLIILFKI